MTREEADNILLKAVVGKYPTTYNGADVIQVLLEVFNDKKELEELLKPKTCEGCKWNDIPFPSNQFHCDECKHAYSCYNDNFEPKER